MVLHFPGKGRTQKTISFFRPGQRLCWQAEGWIQKPTAKKPTSLSASGITTKSKKKPVNSVQVRVISYDLPIPDKSGFQYERTLVKGKIVQAGQLNLV